MNGKSILIACHPATLAPCRLCKTPAPPEHLSPGAICSRCWVNEGAPRGWTLIPPQVCQQANLGAALCSELQCCQNERGLDEPIVLTLRRLLEERERLRVWEASDETQVISARCCYCHEPFRAVGRVRMLADGTDLTESNLQPLQGVSGLPIIWACQDREACCGRVNEQLVARLQANQGTGQVN